MRNPENSEARERVLVQAERLFTERGYEAVSIKDIAHAAGIHHASLYHHSKGKEQLYLEVTERHLKRHQHGMREAIARGADLNAQLHEIAAWLLSQPPMDMIRMVQSDMPALTQAGAAEHLSALAFEVLLQPIEDVLNQAQQRGEIGALDIGMATGAIFSAIEGLFMIPEQWVEGSRLAMADRLIDLFLNGMRPR